MKNRICIDLCMNIFPCGACPLPLCCQPLSGVVGLGHLGVVNWILLQTHTGDLWAAPVPRNLGGEVLGKL